MTPLLPCVAPDDETAREHLRAQLRVLSDDTRMGALLCAIRSRYARPRGHSAAEPVQGELMGEGE